MWTRTLQHTRSCVWLAEINSRL